MIISRSVIKKISKSKSLKVINIPVHLTGSYFFSLQDCFQIMTETIYLTKVTAYAG